MKKAKCARCGTAILVPNNHDLDEDMEACQRCNEELYQEWAEEHLKPEVKDTDPL